MRTRLSLQIVLMGVPDCYVVGGDAMLKIAGKRGVVLVDHSSNYVDASHSSLIRSGDHITSGMAASLRQNGPEYSTDRIRHARKASLSILLIAHACCRRKTWLRLRVL
jgi:hypothetical protein